MDVANSLAALQASRSRAKKSLCPDGDQVVTQQMTAAPELTLGSVIHHVGALNQMAAGTTEAILLLDDDHDYGRLITQVAQHRGLRVDHYESLIDLGNLGRLESYKVVVLDYHLSHTTGLEIAAFLGVKLPWIPALITSADATIKGQLDLPKNVFSVIEKRHGPAELMTALAKVIGNSAG